MTNVLVILQIGFEVAAKVFSGGWAAFTWLLGFLSANTSILGMFFTGLVMILTGDFLGGLLFWVKAAFALFAAAFGWHLTWSGVQASMGPLVPSSKS